jgi:hypothetical protein
MLNRINALEMGTSSINRLTALMEVPQTTLQQRQQAKEAQQRRLAIEIDRRIQA